MHCPKCYRPLETTGGCPYCTQVEYYPPLPPKQPYKCPVCEGTGTTLRPPGVPGDSREWISDGTVYPCKACGGTGVVWG